MLIKMFKAPSENDIKRLYCPICGFSKNVPIHCNKPMRWVLEGNFIKEEYLVCSICNYKMDIPKHCNTIMFYSESNYNDIKIRDE
ncbi:MAG: hypothetical protein KatS3mg003_2315 [Candidatus Nitrosocaldaceae archaeon]|nr:MAG: hypothetical protein KatS3mg003_1524 [Candidatus Nitrosocaldaceae archaeon]GIU72764.1 MAG: hypothetical protein KatS3mg003_2243 [Candidatus Nitrosocaldaceae archaeon]GIU72836.1 MAG: hypothetical protein KatS3mg003_2315 [Candidatus Nitrosocaldaceae archaeon]